MSRPDFNYDIEQLEREKAEYYIPASSKDIEDMLKACDLSSLSDLYKHIKENQKFDNQEFFIERIEDYDHLADHVYEISKKNKLVNSFIGDGLSYYLPSPIIDDICSIRGLTTAYTPYQPERSQGTLQSLWIYQSILKELTGFEAINASLYERSTGIFEAVKCAIRLARKNKKVAIVDSLYEGDKKVLSTLFKNTGINIDYIPLNEETAQVDLSVLENFQDYSCIVFSQITCFGTLEKIHELTDFTNTNKIISVAVIDPITLSNSGLEKPSCFGSNQQGVDIIVGEAQNLALDKNFGGPGLGIFGVRYNEKQKNHIRQAPGRFIGKAKDIDGKICKSIILSTREQHIRRDKATSNICSNQSFVSSLAGANLLYWGNTGLDKKIQKSRDNLTYFVDQINDLEGISLKFKTPVLNEITIKVNQDIKKLIEKGLNQNLEIGVDISFRSNDQNLLKIFFNDKDKSEVDKLIDFFKDNFNKKDHSFQLVEIPKNYLRTEKCSFKNHDAQEVVNYYQKLGKQNLSPDDGIYPLGSCTMKYNPYINDFCASYTGFTSTHPQSDLSLVQGNLEILFEIQEFFNRVTGLAATTTQPVAGAQGELVGLKLFQAYHQDKGISRTKVIIPKSAHGTNPATAIVAGYEIILLNSTDDGQIDMDHLKKIIQENHDDIAGVMVTNPNTSGVFEESFKQMADLIHEIDGLVYMDGANMNAIAGIVNLDKIGVDAVHNNLHKTWTIPHGGGGPGDAIVSVSHKLKDFLPGYQIKKVNEKFDVFQTPKSIGSFHRHWGNFAHKVRCYTYIKALGSDGIRKMSSYAVLSSRYLFHKIKNDFPTLPEKANLTPRMHEFILTLSKEQFQKIEDAGVSKAMIIARVGKLFLDFGFHAPTVAFPEIYGLMIEPTESFTKKELDQFLEVLFKIKEVIETAPHILNTVPHFTPIRRVDELSANRKPELFEEKENNVLFDSLLNPEDDKLQISELKNQTSHDLIYKVQALL